MNDENGPIFFYSTTAYHGCFSNFSRHPVKIGGKTWPTSEHYFQAQKFPGTRHETEILNAKGPADAASKGRDRSRPLRKDWESVKDGIMYDVLKAKFTQYEALKQILLETGDRKIVEHTSRDDYWGDGSDGKTIGPGKNMLGKLLMRLRDELRKNEK